MRKMIRICGVIAVLVAALSMVEIGAAQTDTNWQAAYWNNTTMSGDAQVYRAESNISNDWGEKAPLSGINADGFSVKWVRYVEFNAGTYRFTATSDDGMRVYLNGQLIIDDWDAHQVRTTFVDKELAKGRYYIEVEYYENDGGAIAKFSYATSSSKAGDWFVEYFNEPNLASAPVKTTTASAIDFDWGTGTPISGVPSDNFSARFQSTQPLAAGTYQFSVVADDGVRLYVNGQLLIDKWQAQTDASYTADATITGTSTNILLEYYEGIGDAKLKLSWAVTGTAATVPSASSGVTSVTTITETPGSRLIDDGGINGGYLWWAGGPRDDWETITGGYGGTSRRSLNADSVSRDYNWARYFPLVSETRDYEVFVYVPFSDKLTTHARYWVRHRRGYHKVIVNQRTYAGQWVSLGTHPFAGYSYEFVSLSDMTEETNRTTYVVWDAVMLIPR